MAEDYATLGHYDKASALFEAYRKGGQVENPVFAGFEDIYSKLSECGSFSVDKPNYDVCALVNPYWRPQEPGDDVCYG